MSKINEIIIFFGRLILNNKIIKGAVEKIIANPLSLVAPVSPIKKLNIENKINVLHRNLYDNS